MSNDRAAGLRNFLTGLRLTFSAFISTPDEEDDFFLSAEAFYRSYRGLPIFSSTESRLPFFRYIVHYSTLGLDSAQSVEPEEENAVTQAVQELAREMMGYWPFMAVLAHGDYAKLREVEEPEMREPAVRKRQMSVDSGTQMEGDQVEALSEEEPKSSTSDYTP